MNKRERTVNFTRGEIDLLVNLVEKRKSILENKQSDGVTWRKKDEEWAKVEAEFNAVSREHHFRLAKHLRTKYETIKRCVRKKSANIRRETYKTGGGPNTAPPLTPTETKVKDMILLSVEGMESEFDSDIIIQVEDNATDLCSLTHSGSIPATIPETTMEFEGENSYCLEEINCPDNVQIHIVEHNSTLKPSEDTVAAENSPLPISETPQTVKAGASRWDNWQPSKLRTPKHPALQGTKTVGKLADVRKQVALLQKELLIKDLEDKEIERKHRQEEYEEKEKEYAEKERERAFNEEMRQLQKEKILLEIKKLHQL